MHILRDNQLYGKLSKSSFYQKKMLYFIHIIFKDLVSVDLAKAKVINEFPSIKNVIEFITIYGSGRLLLNIHIVFLLDYKYDFILTEEGCEVNLESKV